MYYTLTNKGSKPLTFWQDEVATPLSPGCSVDLDSEAQIVEPCYYEIEKQAIEQAEEPSFNLYERHVTLLQEFKIFKLETNKRIYALEGGT